MDDVDYAGFADFDLWFAHFPLDRWNQYILHNLNAKGLKLFFKLFDCEDVFD